ncbi:hypothetical protein TSUD_154100 [Trifolium subterraneum]|uniref:IMS import disulfide relay-system CHCH-CHCH-like Cx9C domain-containing protein n=1 Tax=Trifolium subterraneum TaxID=3900 RepID=A0A2Z6P589_TRISU|nr:hypothetical protein TSUD_154100 [Trifolium subterraneum]
MGRKAGGLYINSKRFSSLQKPCMKEMTMFLTCMATNPSDVQACAQKKEILNTCIESQSKKNRKSWGSINYQLQRLSRGRKRWICVDSLVYGGMLMNNAHQMFLQADYDRLG